MAHNSYKNLFETLKKKAKEKYYSKKVSKYKHDATKRRNIMKELVAKIFRKSSNLGEHKIANGFNVFFINMGSILGNKIPNAAVTFESYIIKLDSIMETKQLSINELKNASFSLKINKNPSYDGISFRFLKKCFSSLCELLNYCKKRICQHCFQYSYFEVTG